jgi:hypothetical protein
VFFGVAQTVGFCVGGGGAGGGAAAPPGAAHALAVACPAVAGSLSGKTMIGRTSTEP